MTPDGRIQQQAHRDAPDQRAERMMTDADQPYRIVVLLEQLVAEQRDQTELLRQILAVLREPAAPRPAAD
jgi:hypothetical protein